jgi:hypothetical protein
VVVKTIPFGTAFHVGCAGERNRSGIDFYEMFILWLCKDCLAQVTKCSH